MDQNLNPSSSPIRDTLPTAPPTYDEAVGNVAHQNSVLFGEDELKKGSEDQKKQSSTLNASAPPVFMQPQPQQEMTHVFSQPPPQQSLVGDSCLMCIWCDGECISDLCYAIFCCSRHVTGHDAGCCDCGDTCCDCPDGCCDCGDCDCGDCDCGDCDCSGCGDCSIL